LDPILTPTFSLTYLTDLDHPRQGDFEWYDVHMHNFTGNALNNRIFWMDCPKHSPCHDFTFSDINIKPGKTDHPEIQFVCNNFVLDGKDGLDNCHPSDSKLETDNDGTL
jgi:hypothetical protein